MIRPDHQIILVIVLASALMLFGVKIENDKETERSNNSIPFYVEEVVK